MMDGRTEIQVLETRTMTSNRYRRDVIERHVRLPRGVVGEKFPFMVGNARPHQTIAVEIFLESEDIHRTDWPASFPELDPIEHMWDVMGR